MTIGLICAIPQELAALHSVLQDTHTEAVAHAQFITGVLDGHDVVLAGSGMGKVNAALVTTVLADRFRCPRNRILRRGRWARPDARPGDVVVADQVIQHDAGCPRRRPGPRLSSGARADHQPHRPAGPPADPGLLAKVRERLAGVEIPGQIVYGTVLSGDQYLNCQTTRERLPRDFGGRAIEMEGGAVAQVCEAFGLPWLVIRALSDLAGGNALFDFTTFVDQASATSAMILRRIPPMI